MNLQLYWAIHRINRKRPHVTIASTVVGANWVTFKIVGSKSAEFIKGENNGLSDTA